MKNEKKKCSFNEHKEFNASFFCKNCNLYICNKCEKIHSGWFKNHNIYNLDKDLNEIFNGLCQEENHSCELDYFCKTHNLLCCAKCITKIKNKENGQHTDCQICLIKDIENLKKNKLEENIKYLEDISTSLEQSINDLKQIFENFSNSKEEIKLNIQKIFTNIRNVINEREDELILNVDKEFNELYFNENIIKESEKLPKKVKYSLEKGKKINNKWNFENLNCCINDCLNIEKNINEIKNINDILKNNNIMNIEIKFIVEEDNINNIINEIKKLGKFKKNSEFVFDTKIDFDQKLIKEWLNNKKFSSELLFRKTRDGSTPKEFHDKCDNKGITITFIETTKGYKFGAYTELPWDSKKGCKKDSSTFLFSLNNKQIYKAKNDYGSIGCNDCNDLWFGSGFPEIYFTETLNKGRSYNSKGGSTFEIKRALTNQEEYWDVNELEVFKITYI